MRVPERPAAVPGTVPEGAPTTAPATRSDTAWTWPHELRGALNATALMLPFVLSYGFIAFGGLGAYGAQATQAGLGAAVTSIVLGGLLLALVGRLPLPSASPSVSNCLIVASGVATWLRDPALQPGAPGGLAALLALVGLAVVGAGVLQVAMGLLRAGRLVRYVPQPVLAGFMNGVAVLIVLSQLAPALGVDVIRLAGDGIAALAGWQPLALGVTLVTAALAWGAGRLTPRLPSALLALFIATAAVALLQAALGPDRWPGIERIGSLQAVPPLPLALVPFFGDAGWALLQRHGGSLLSVALLLGLIGALESVLNLAAVDQQSQRHSDPDRALVSIGAVNVALGLFGALPVVYLRLRALATLSAGGRTWRAMVAGSVLLAVVFTGGLSLVALVPKPVVAGLLIMLAWALVDRWTLGLLRRPGADAAPDRSAVDAGNVADRRLSLAVVAAVCAVTVLWGFVPGVTLGVLLSFVILVRSLERSLVRQRHTAHEIPSRRIYAPAQERWLGAARRGITLLELEGALFFGNVERLAQEVRSLVGAGGAAPPLQTLVLDLRRVSTIDASGAVMLAGLRDLLAARGVVLRLAGVAADNRHGDSLRAHGVLAGANDGTWALHDDADRAIEAAEQAALAAAGGPAAGAPIALAHCELFAGLDAAEFECVAALLQARSLAAGERLFAQGEAGDALFALSAGSISVVDRARRQRFVSFSPGMTFGEMALLDRGGRTADAVADEASTVHALDAAAMARLESEAPAVAARLYRNLALHLATRLRAASTAWQRAAG